MSSPSGAELLDAAYVYLDHFVDPAAALVDGFDVLAWCDAVDRARDRSPLEGGEAEAHTGASHGVSPPSSGPTDPHPEGPLT